MMFRGRFDASKPRYLGTALRVGILLVLPFAGCECPFSGGTEVPPEANKISCGCICDERITACPVALGDAVLVDPVFNKGIFASAPGDVIFFDLGNTLIDATGTLFDDVRSTLELLKSVGVRVGIITNFPGTLDELEALIEDPDFLDEFELVVISSQVGAQKPQIGIYQAALDMLSDPPSVDRVAFVTEEIDHIANTVDAPTLGARAVGMIGILKSDVPNERANFTFPDVQSLAGSPAKFPLCMPPELNPFDAGNAQELDAAREFCESQFANGLEKMVEHVAGDEAIACCCVGFETLADRNPDCEAECVENPMPLGATDYSDADGFFTHLEGNPPPLCLARGIDPPEPLSQGLAGSAFGPHSVCEIAGVVAGDSPDLGSFVKPASGAMTVNGSPCPGAFCSLSAGFEVRLLDDVTFGVDCGIFDFLPGCEDVDVTDVRAAGATLPEALTLDDVGDAIIRPGEISVLGQGKEDGDRFAFVSTNPAEAAVSVAWLDKTCALDTGASLTAEGLAPVETQITLLGRLVNQPPHAEAGPPARAVECTSPAGAAVSLDASLSQDADGDTAAGNIHWYAWRRGTSFGGDVIAAGRTPVATVQQALGTTESYSVRVFDRLFQTSLDTQTTEVVDTTAPTIECNVPAAITPRDAPVSFAATASDVCDDGLAAPLITAFDCFTVTKKQRRVGKNESCVVTATGDTITIWDAGGVGDVLAWRVEATDASGNSAAVVCEVEVVNPAQGG